MQKGGVSEPPLFNLTIAAESPFARNLLMKEERVSTASSGRSSRPGTQQRGPPPDWRISFGFWTELDALYHSFPPPKPRCPELPVDSALEWKKRLVPDDIDTFLGNPAAATCLRAVTSSVDADTGPALTNFIISGGNCTGKSTFAGILRKTLFSLTPEQPCRFATVNASEFAGDKVLQSKLEDAVRRLEALKPAAVSFLTIERFESVTPSMQQHFFVPLLAEANVKKIFVILLVRPDTNKLAEQIKTQATKVHLQSLPANLVRTKLLLVCQQERIGYTREGLEEITKLCSFKLLPCLEKLHEVFLKQYFISQANVLKICQATSSSSSTSSSATAPPFQLSVLRMSEPLRRCPKCTLLPPCSHVSLEKLFSRIDEARALYPENGLKLESKPTTISLSTPDKPGSPAVPERPVCPSFGRRGVCTNTQKLGRCRYAHPLHLHTIDTTALVPRCRAHTLPLPCLHCNNAEQLKVDIRGEISACETMKRELLRSRQVLADLETQRFLIARDRGKAAKWGGAKKAADEQLARMDAALNSARTSVKHQEEELFARQEALVKLQDAAAHGRSSGLGKGNGRIELKHEQNPQRRHQATAVAAV